MALIKHAEPTSCAAVIAPQRSRSPNRRHIAGEVWPLVAQGCHLDFADILNSLIADVIDPVRVGATGLHHAGLWECDLADQSLIWSGGVYDIFGLDRSMRVSRAQALACYSDDSRVKLERLRAYAIRHRLGFTIDIEVRAAAVRETRHVRLIGAPLFESDRAVRLHGVKLLI